MISEVLELLRSEEAGAEGGGIVVLVESRDGKEEGRGGRES
jgi:hypothetical protein